MCALRLPQVGHVRRAVTLQRWRGLSPEPPQELGRASVLGALTQMGHARRAAAFNGMERGTTGGGCGCALTQPRVGRGQHSHVGNFDALRLGL